MGSGVKAGLVGLAALVCVPAVAGAREPSLSARAALIMDASTGEVLWDRNGTEPLPPASTTKVMTAILALESGRLDDSMRVSADAAAAAPSKINLRPGQRMQLRSLVYAALLNSANDAATVIAEGLAGSEDAFAARMNAKAHEIGARTAHFVNPHGLTAAGHVASPRDLATIFRYGLRVPLFREVLGTRTIEVPIQSGDDGLFHRIGLKSHNRLLTGYTYRVIGKTGYTRPAHRCFVGAASNGEREIIVALERSNDLWGDAKKLFSYGFGGNVESPKVLMAGALPVPNLLARRTTTAPEGDDDVADDAAPSGRYTVQLGPYPSKRAASSTRSKLASRGYSVLLNGRRLRIGSYETMKTASRVAGKLRASGYRPMVVALR
jgi:D-alanyl-D-alanine carboxypeptidase